MFFMGQWSLQLEARAMACAMLFWVLEDYLWFVLNPAFGWRRFKPEFVPWHKRWVMWVPVDYWFFSAGGTLLYWFSV
jgi:hypothetical protein